MAIDFAADFLFQRIRERDIALLFHTWSTLAVRVPRRLHGDLTTNKLNGNNNKIIRNDLVASI